MKEKLNLKALIKTKQKILIMAVPTMIIIYTLIHMILVSDNFISYLLSGFVVLFVIIGLIYLYIDMRHIEINKVNLKHYDFLFAFTGVLLTYELVNFFQLSSVLVSSGLGLLGFLFFKKYSVAFYCGTFAGMMSPLLFSRWEIIVLAIFCSLLYIVIKTALIGFGGRLGTIAFISSVVIGLIFQKNGLEISYSINFYLVLIFSISGSFISYYLHNTFNLSSVFASAFPSFIVVVLLEIFAFEMIIYSVVFFTASFIGMSNNKIIPNALNLLFVGVILSIIFFAFYNLFNGFGGKMGFMALISIIIYFGLTNLWKDIFKNKKIKAYFL